MKNTKIFSIELERKSYIGAPQKAKEYEIGFERKNVLHVEFTFEGDICFKLCL